LITIPAVLRGCGAKPDGDFGAAGGVVVGRDGAVVALGQGVDDGQSESGAAGGARGVGASESVEGMREETKWESGTVVADMDLDALGAEPPDGNGDRRGAVLGGIVDEVADDPIEVVRVCADVLACGAIDVELAPEAVTVTLADRLQMAV
jgi:hypothetical protein